MESVPGKRDRNNRKSRSEVPEKEGILGKKIGWGRVGWTGQKKKGNKRMRKKRWEFFPGFNPVFDSFLPFFRNPEKGALRKFVVN